jgi:hypothetical protein
MTDDPWEELDTEPAPGHPPISEGDDLPDDVPAEDIAASEPEEME